MTELARTEFNAPAPTGFARVAALPARAAAPSAQFDRMGKWLELFIATEQVAGVLARTAFVPEPMRGQPENVAAAMMKSLELGIDPLDGLQSMHVVKGKIGFSAEFMRRRIIEAGHEIVIDESTDDRCKIRGRRAGSEWQTVVFTADQAKRAKIALGDYPADKLVARASSRLCRRVFPDVLAGTTIVDEIEDGVEVVDGSSTSAPVQRKRQPRAVKAKAEPRPAPSSDVDDLLDDEPAPASNSRPKPETVQVNDDDLLDDPTAETPAAEPDGPSTRQQNADINRLFKAAEITEKQDKRDVTTHIIGYEVTGLTTGEAAKLIAQLKQWEAAGSLLEQVWAIVDPADPEQDAEPGVDGITDAQKTKLAIIRDERYAKTPKGRGEWFAWVTDAIGREVASNTELTKYEAMRLLDLLEPERSEEVPPTTDEGNN